MPRRLIRIGPPLVALAILACVAAETLSFPQPEEAEPYHRAIREAMAAIPERIGPWKGEQVPVTASAVELLKPNVLEHRRYVNLDTNQDASVLVVQCYDARDMAGHYPPICYPAQGYTEVSRRPAEWDIDGYKLIGMEYTFGITRHGQREETVVDHFFILPNGEIGRDNAAVRRAASDYLNRFYGAAQVQVVFSAMTTSPEERKEIFQQLIAAYLPLIDAVRSGEKQ